MTELYWFGLVKSGNSKQAKRLTESLQCFEFMVKINLDRRRHDRSTLVVIFDGFFQFHVNVGDCAAGMFWDFIEPLEIAVFIEEIGAKAFGIRRAMPDLRSHSFRGLHETKNSFHI